MQSSKSDSREDFTPGPRRNSTGANRGRRRSSLLEQAQASPAAHPRLPSTWKATWAAAFEEFQHDGEVYRENLADLLIHIGHRSPDKKLIDSVTETVEGSSNTLSTEQVYEFICNYHNELQAERRRMFQASAQNQGGKVPVQELGQLIQKRGYTPVPHAVAEVLKDAVQELGEDIGDGVALNVFERLLVLLEQQEGFCKSDLAILEGAFQRYDRNNNGQIDSWELHDVLESLDFCLAEGVVKSLAADTVRDNGGTLTFKDFLSISRKRIQLEFDHCQALFKKCDEDEDELLRPVELMRLFSRLGVSLLPETLADLTEECEVDGEAINFPGFWQILQVLRAREGCTLQEAADIHEVFQRIDSTDRNEMPLKRIPAALQWLGYQSGPGVIGKANKQIEIPATGRGFITEAQFMKLVRKHREAQLKAIRKVYRSFAEDGGVGKLHMENLQAAVTRLNRLFVNDFVDWIKMFRPGGRVNRKHTSFDFEEFRIIVLHCCDKLRARIHKNCGYSEVQLSKLRIEFVKYTKDGSSTEVDAPGLMKLFKALLPQAQTSPTVRSRLRTALERNSAKTKGLDWHAFLRVMQAYDELAELDSEAIIEAGIDELDMPEECVDKAQDLLTHLCQIGRCATTAMKANAPAQLTVEDLLFLVQSIAPGLTEAQAEEALEQFLEAEKQGIEGEFCVVPTLTKIVLNGELGKRSDQPKAHDLAGPL